MSKTKKIKYTKGPIGKIKIVSDFLPSPKNLVLKNENIEIRSPDLDPGE